MQVINKLSANEIESILAKHFGCEATNVNIFIEETATGYGLAEHTEYNPVATVKIEKPLKGADDE